MYTFTAFVHLKNKVERAERESLRKAFEKNTPQRNRPLKDFGGSVDSDPCATNDGKTVLWFDFRAKNAYVADDLASKIVSKFEAQVERVDVEGSY